MIRLIPYSALFVLLLFLSACGSAELENQENHNAANGETDDIGAGDDEHSADGDSSGDHESSGDGEDIPNGDTTGDQESGDQESGDQDPTGEDPNVSTLTATSQNVELSTLYVVDSLDLVNDSFLLVFEESCDGEPPLAAPFLPAGTYSNLNIAFSEPLAGDGETIRLCLAIYEDDGDGVFDPLEDTALEGPDSQALVDVTVAPGTPAVRIRIASQGSLSYTFLDITPDIFGDTVDTDPASTQNDPRFTFSRGWRYELVNTVSGAHPFQFLNPAGSPQLAQNVTAPLESSAAIDWDHSGSIMRFTISDDFESNINSYRCAPHISMFGAVRYVD